ncbi:MAG: diacylglycerol kinase family protein [Rhodospirillales bacterium]
MQKLHVIINRRAGTVLNLGEVEVERALRAGLAAGDLDYRLEFVEPGALATRLREALASPVEAIAVGGGDGTLRTAAGLALGSDKPLAILPLGTLNLQSKDLGIPQYLEEAATAILSGRYQQVDVGLVNGELFLVKAMIGRVNASVKAREKSRSRFSPLRWAAVLWQAASLLLRGGRRRFLLQVAGKQLEVHTSMLTVAVNRMTGSLENPFSRPILDQGLLAVYRFPRVFGDGHGSDAPWQREIYDSFLLGEDRELALDARQASLYASLDGELVLLKTPLRFSLHPDRLTMIAARG